jgi:hypothetical protein
LTETKRRKDQKKGQQWWLGEEQCEWKGKRWERANDFSRFKKTQGSSGKKKQELVNPDKGKKGLLGK